MSIEPDHYRGNPPREYRNKLGLMKVVLFAAAIYVPFGDYATSINFISGLSLNGISSVVFAVLFFSAAIFFPIKKTVAQITLPLLVFLPYCVITTLLSDAPKFNSFQNIILYATFIFGAVSIWSRLGRDIESYTNICSFLTAIITLTAAVYILLCFVGGIGHAIFVSPRTAAIYFCLALVFVLFTERTIGRTELIQASLLSVAILLSGSRTMMGVMIVVLSYYAYSSPKKWSALIALALVTVSIVLVIVYSEAWQFIVSRFTEGDNALTIGQYEISTSGRSVLWYTLVSAAEERFLFGSGAGAANHLLMSVFRIDHPHNEYLRIYFDFGVLGASLWLAFFVAVAMRLLKKRSRRASRRLSVAHENAGLCFFMVYLASALTDNPFVYLNVVISVLVYISFPVMSMDVDRRTSVC